MKREGLIAYRKAKGLTQKEVADSIKISSITYSAYESGSRTPKPKVAMMIARIFDFNWTKFYEEE